MAEKCSICGEDLILVGEQEKGRCVDCYTQNEIQSISSMSVNKDHKMLALTEIQDVIGLAAKILYNR